MWWKLVEVAGGGALASKIRAVPAGEQKVLVEYVGRDALRFIEAALGPAVAGGYESPGGEQVDNRALFAALRKACDVLGVSVVEGAEVVNDVASLNGQVVDRLVLASEGAIQSLSCINGGLGAETASGRAHASRERTNAMS
jgi:glycine/D-amino acid oxidase-like deaminating enzyme